jgi:uncharacterized membrane protein
MLRPADRPSVPAAVPPSLSEASRWAGLDALRGVAVVWMVLFHLAYDLNHFGWIIPRQQFLSDPFWTLQRIAIVSLFMFCAGFGQALAWQQGVAWSRFWRRWAQVAGCAVLVSVATWWVFGPRWISFGVLHGLAVMILLARLMAGWPLGALLAMAALALALPQFVQHPVFDNRWLDGVGLVTRKPAVEDYAPVLPWLGVMLVGLVAGRTLPAAVVSSGDRWENPWWMSRWLSAVGRWSLSIYMVHQPLFWGFLSWIGPPR